MSIFFTPDDANPPLPRAEVRIEELSAEPYPDGGRVRMTLTLTPFLERPNLEIYARKQGGPIVAELSVIETMMTQLDFTLHIRGVESLPGTYVLRAELYYDERTNPQDVRETTFLIPLMTESESID